MSLLLLKFTNLAFLCHGTFSVALVICRRFLSFGPTNIGTVDYLQENLWVTRCKKLCWKVWRSHGAWKHMMIFILLNRVIDIMWVIYTFNVNVLFWHDYLFGFRNDAGKVAIKLSVGTMFSDKQSVDAHITEALREASWEEKIDTLYKAWCNLPLPPQQLNVDSVGPMAVSVVTSCRKIYFFQRPYDELETKISHVTKLINYNIEWLHQPNKQYLNAKKPIHKVTPLNM